MTVLSAAVVARNGTILVARQYVDINKSRIEAILVSFPKLIDSSNKSKEHTFVESENIRYVYQPLDTDIFMVLVTNLNSNIIQDLDSLRLFARIVSEVTKGTLKQSVIEENAFEILFAFDEIISFGGHREVLNFNELVKIIQMESQDEKVQDFIAKRKEQEAKEQVKLKQKQIDAQRKEAKKSGTLSMQSFGRTSPYISAASNPISSAGSTFESPVGYTDSESARSAPRRGMQLGSQSKKTDILRMIKDENGVADLVPQNLDVPIPKEGIVITIEERVKFVIDRHGGLQEAEIQGSFSLFVNQESMRKIRISVTDMQFQKKLHPKIDKSVFNNTLVLALQKVEEQFPLGTECPLIKWMHQSQDLKLVPLTVSCWPTPAGNGTCDVAIEYELENRSLELNNVVIKIPLPDGCGSPIVDNVDGDYDYDDQEHILLWSVSCINSENAEGSIKFKVGGEETDRLFPIKIVFESKNLISGIQVKNIVDAETHEPYKYDLKSRLITNEYLIV